MTPDVVSVKPLTGYRLEAGFANGERRLFDMRPYLAYPAFAPLAEGALFMRAHVALGTVAWTEEIDLSPDTLYLRGAPVEPAGVPEQDAFCKSVPNVCSGSHAGALEPEQGSGP